jgi:hypothetical protein
MFVERAQARRWKMVSKVTLAAIAGLVLTVAPGSADAQSARELREGRLSTCSNYGNGCVTVPLRRARYDYEFRMPSGSWVSCRKDCKSALREEVLDFWETLRERSGDRAR